MESDIFKGIDVSPVLADLESTVDETHERIANEMISELEYRELLEDSIFKTRNALLEIQKASEDESIIEAKRFKIQTILSVASLAAAVVAAVAAIIALL